MTIKAHIVDVLNRNLYDGELLIGDGKILSVNRLSNLSADAPYILPGFVDSHVHIESSMLLPEEFGNIAIKHGTVAAVCDPHEIANVLGVEGIDFMIENSKRSPLHFFFAAPSCVPSTSFETSGAVLDSKAILSLMQRDDIYALGEVMNAVGVLNDDAEVWTKIRAAHSTNKPIDGHAPLLSGEDLKKYVSAIISTDHECTSIAEAEEKLSLGVSILLRSGSAANDFRNLMSLLATHQEKLMFCSDDKHPDDLLTGHINLMVKQALAAGYPIWNILRAACVEPVLHYKLPVGLLQSGQNADFIVVDNLEHFNIVETYISGKPVQVSSDIATTKTCDIRPNNFHRAHICEDELVVMAEGSQMKVIESFGNSIITRNLLINPKCDSNNRVAPDVSRDVLKIVVVNRYDQSAPPQMAFIKGFGLKRGAIASTIAHDSHNLIAVGCDDTSLVNVLNCLIDSKGGIAVCYDDNIDILQLPIAGLMSPLSAVEVATAYQRINNRVHTLGSQLNAPFMTLSFMALPVIPHLKITDKGLFDGDVFSFTSLFQS